ncbi:phospholipase D-like domain-containing protein [Jatrophihabitans sp. DSM 45814]
MAAPQVQAFFLRDTRHGGASDQATAVADKFASFVEAATSTIDFAIYDFRLSDDALVNTVVSALTEAADRGVAVRIAYDAGKPAAATAETFAKLAADPAPPGTAAWVDQHFEGTKVQTKAITASSGQLMHSKYLVRDGAKKYHTAAVWTGSTNFTDDAWTLQENNIITVTSQTLAPAYLADFKALWSAGAIKGTGLNDAGTTTAGHVTVAWDFAPGDGKAVDAALTAAVEAAKTRIVLAAMVLTSRTVLAALVAAIARNVPVSGIYDSGQMGPIEKEWAKSASSASTLGDWKTVKAHLVAKKSAPYTADGPHDFMHNKILIIDSTLATGSYNFSANAEHNAENQLHISHDPSLVSQYAAYIATIASEYS